MEPKIYLIDNESYTEDDLITMIKYYKSTRKPVYENHSLTNIEVDNILNKLPELKSIHMEYGTNYEQAYQKALKYGNKYRIKSLIKWGKVSDYKPTKIKFCSIGLDKLLKYSKKSEFDFLEKIEERGYPFVYTGRKMNIHLSEKPDDLPTISIDVDGGISRGDILYHIAKNLPALNYYNHLLLEGLYMENDIYYLSLS